MLPDTGERYLSTVLFDDVSVDMSKEEREIAASTPRYRFDACTSPLKPAEASSLVGEPAIDSMFEA